MRVFGLALIILVMVTFITGCFQHVVDVDKIRSSKIVVLDGKQIEMPKSGCYLDGNHGKICTGSSYIVRNNQWEFDYYNDKSEVKHLTKKDITGIDDIPSVNYDETLAKSLEVIGAVVLFALVIGGVYAAAKYGVNKYTGPVTNYVPSSGCDNGKFTIDDSFNGWDGDTIVSLNNGTIYKQTGYHYEYHYAYRPSVSIFNNGGCKMFIEGTLKPVEVEKIK